MGYGVPFALCVRWLGQATCGGPMPGGVWRHGPFARSVTPSYILAVYYQ